MKIKKFSFLFIIPFCLFSCSGNKYSLVTFDILKEKYEPVVENCNYSYSQLKEYLTDLPYLIPGDKIKINYNKEGIPESFKLQKAKYTYIKRGIGICGISHEFYIDNYHTQALTKFDWSYFKDTIKVVDTDLSMTIVLEDYKIPDESYITYNEGIKNNKKYVIQSIWKKEVFDKYYLNA